MIAGIIQCGCGQEFGFSTLFETVQCPNCHKEYIAAEHGEEETIVEEVET